MTPRWIALALLAVAQFVVVLDGSIVNVALPSIGRTLHFSQQNLPFGNLLFPSILVGLGLGLSFVPLTLAAVGSVPSSEYGLASGLINSSQQVGGAIGIALLSSVATSRTSDVMAAAHGNLAELARALTAGFASAFLAGATLAAFGIVVALVLIPGRERRATSTSEVQTEAA